MPTLLAFDVWEKVCLGGDGRFLVGESLPRALLTTFADGVTIFSLELPVNLPSHSEGENFKLMDSEL